MHVYVYCMPMCIHATQIHKTHHAHTTHTTQHHTTHTHNTEDSNAEHAAKLLHWALLQGTHIDLAHTTTTSVATQSGATHALLQQASCKVTAIVGEGSEHVEEDTEEEEEEVVGSGSGSSPHATAQHDDDAQHAQHAVQGTPVVHDGVDVEMGAVNGAVNGVSNKSTGGGTMEVAKSDMARVWRSENRVCGLCVLVVGVVMMLLLLLCGPDTHNSTYTHNLHTHTCMIHYYHTHTHTTHKHTTHKHIANIPQTHTRRAPSARSHHGGMPWVFCGGTGG